MDSFLRHFGAVAVHTVNVKHSIEDQLSLCILDILSKICETYIFSSSFNSSCCGFSLNHRRSTCDLNVRLGFKWQAI